MALTCLAASFLFIGVVSGVVSSAFISSENVQKVHHDNTWCFKGVYDYDNCPGEWSLLISLNVFFFKFEAIVTTSVSDYLSVFFSNSTLFLEWLKLKDILV